MIDKTSIPLSFLHDPFKFSSFNDHREEEKDWLHGKHQQVENSLFDFVEKTEISIEFSCHVSLDWKEKCEHFRCGLICIQQWTTQPHSDIQHFKPLSTYLNPHSLADSQVPDHLAETEENRKSLNISFWSRVDSWFGWSSQDTYSSTRFVQSNFDIPFTLILVFEYNTNSGKNLGNMYEYISQPQQKHIYNCSTSIISLKHERFYCAPRI